MAIHHIDGQEVDLKRWLEEQKKAAEGWDQPDERFTPEDTIRAWATLFAAFSRDMCEKLNVDVDTFFGQLPDFENRLAPLLGELKWYLSEQQQRDVGYEGIRPYLKITARNILDAGTNKYGARVEVWIPSVTKDGVDQSNRKMVSFFFEAPGQGEPREEPALIGAA
jgi:hypothetical protein